MPSLWVAELAISARTAEKLRRKHQLEPDDVRDALVCVRGLRFVVEDEPSYHVIVEFWLGRDRMLASLYPNAGMAEDAWNLASAYRVGR